MKIMLACCLGMSTSVVVQKMKDAAKEQGKDYEIWAVDQNKIAENVGPAGAPSAAQGQGNCG